MLILSGEQDKNLGEQISVTVIATGFEATSIPELYIKKTKTDKVKLSEPSPPSGVKKVDQPTQDGVTDYDPADRSNVQRTFEFDISGGDQQLDFFVSDANEKSPDTGEKKSKELAERVKKLRKSHEKVKEQLYNKANDNESIDELENEPAYVRKKIKIDESKPSSESRMSKYSLSEDDENNAKLREDNAYLHDNVD